MTPEQERKWWEALWAAYRQAKRRGDIGVIDLTEFARSGEGLALLGLTDSLTASLTSASALKGVAAMVVSNDWLGLKACGHDDDAEFAERVTAWRTSLARQKYLLYDYSRWVEGGRRGSPISACADLDPRLAALADAAERWQQQGLRTDLSGSEQVWRRRFAEYHDVGQQLLDQPGSALPRFSWEPPRVESEEPAPILDIVTEFEGGSFAY